MTRSKSVTLLVTGFGPYPGAPFNPTGALARRVARLRRNANIVAHVFPTTYAAVDRDLPLLVARHRPDALLMFGLAPRAKAIRIETTARNVAALAPDASGAYPRMRSIVQRAPFTRAMPAPSQRLLAAVRSARFPATLSRDAGRYLCNYISWRAAELVEAPGGPRLAIFIHVPPLAARRPRRVGTAGARLPSFGQLLDSATAIAGAMIAASQR